MKRVRSILLVALSLVLGAAPAGASGVNLAWGECIGGGGATFNDFTCDTNDGFQVLVASVLAPAGIDQLVAFETELQITPTGSVFPDWWRLRNQAGQSNQCRNGTLSSSADFDGWTGCTDVYLSQATGGITSYAVGAGGSSSAILHIDYALPAGQAAALEPETEYYTARILISNAKTIGSGSCAGCMTPTCITATLVRCVQAAGSPNVDVGAPAVGSTVGWHSVAWSDCGCAAVTQKIKGPSTCTITCPAQNATWGRVKSLYR